MPTLKMSWKPHDLERAHMTSTSHCNYVTMIAFIRSRLWAKFVLSPLLRQTYDYEPAPCMEYDCGQVPDREKQGWYCAAACFFGRLWPTYSIRDLSRQLATLNSNIFGRHPSRPPMAATLRRLSAVIAATACPVIRRDLHYMQLPGPRPVEARQYVHLGGLEGPHTYASTPNHGKACIMLKRPEANFR